MHPSVQQYFLYPALLVSRKVKDEGPQKNWISTKAILINVWNVDKRSGHTAPKLSIFLLSIFIYAAEAASPSAQSAR